jgi:NADH dehydrogenase
MQGGRHAARAISAKVAGEPLPQFRYRDKGTLATIGRSAGVAKFPHLQLSGFLAWAAWLFIHLLFLIGFRNRVLVLIEWAWSYLTYRRGARLITEVAPPTARTPPAPRRAEAPPIVHT